MPASSLPLIDLTPLTSHQVSSRALNNPEVRRLADQIRTACEEVGFFYITGYGVSSSLERRLEEVATRFFSRPIAEKRAIRMSLGGHAWRGWFPLGDELTSGAPDQKEGLYFGEELAPDHPLTLRQTPLHGPNLFFDAEMKSVVLEWMRAMTQLGHRLMCGIALSLGLSPDHFSAGCMQAPLGLFRMFHYPSPLEVNQQLWGVGEHTDYGVLTILKQDQCGGLQVKVGGSQQGSWVEAPPLRDTLIVNLGDMLERMTGGLYLSTPHRVRNTSGRSRYSFPFFFDPNYFAPVQPIEGVIASTRGRANRSALGRWDHESVHEGEVSYGDYLLKKVGRVFPALSQSALNEKVDPQRSQ